MKKISYYNFLTIVCGTQNTSNHCKSLNPLSANPTKWSIHSNNSSAKAGKLFDHLWGWRVKGQGKITVNDVFDRTRAQKKYF